MGLRKAHCYSKPERPYTRKSKKRIKSYIKTIPPSKIAKYVMGDIQGFNQKKYPFSVSLIALKAVQIRDNALEASRQLILRHLEKKLKGSFYFTLNVYPHQILREHKQAAVAQADRMFQGMALSFGKPVNIAARVSSNTKVFTILCNKEAVPIVRKIVSKVKPKIPGKSTLLVEKIKK